MRHWKKKTGVYAQADNSDAKLTVIEGEYNGHPTLTFQGPFRQFTLGLKKLRVIKEALPQIDSFLQKHVNQHSGSEHTYDDDVKI